MILVLGNLKRAWYLLVLNVGPIWYSTCVWAALEVIAESLGSGVTADTGHDKDAVPGVSSRNGRISEQGAQQGGVKTYAALYNSYIHPVHCALLKTLSWYCSRSVPETRLLKKVHVLAVGKELMTEGRQFSVVPLLKVSVRRR